ncbi:MAG: thioredoxin [Rhodospirillales bacterium]|nr:thioredoxin [Rhodospirillales bacterium]MCW8952978.1 thioredoxin [Rhodospirillales bacterium]MCW9002332.1 thioredoxin [Rhodospirillales bacterium]MCW9040027.1 thioredoxin [Rhodospirillales bacterium]
MPTIEMGLDNFESTIKDNEIVLVDFWAEWCGPCKSFGPVFEAASDKFPEIVFAKVNTEKEQQLAGQFGIRSIPTLAVFRDRILLMAQPGALPAQALEQVVSQVKDLDMDDVRQKIAEHEQNQNAQP